MSGLADDKTTKNIDVKVRHKRRVPLEVEIPNVPQLKAEKDALLVRLNELDQQRGQLRAERRALHGLAGSIEVLSNLKERDLLLLNERNDICLRVGELKKQIKSANKERFPTPESMGAIFMRVAKQELARDEYLRLLELTKKQLQPEAPAHQLSLKLPGRE